jgi:hypothetical protein
VSDEVTTPKKVHRRYEGKGKQTAWNPPWISVPGLLRFHATLILLTIDPRSSIDAHFITDALINSPIAQIYTKTAWQQTTRYFSAHDPTTFASDRKDPLYTPYAKYEIIYQLLQENIRFLYQPGQELSYDEDGKPYMGKGGHGVTVHNNPKKPSGKTNLILIARARQSCPSPRTTGWIRCLEDLRRREDALCARDNDKLQLATAPTPFGIAARSARSFFAAGSFSEFQGRNTEGFEHYCT